MAAVVLAAGCGAIAGDARDRTLERQLTDRLASDPGLAYVMVSVRGDTAYLTGWVSRNARSQQAERLAADLPGITRVFNSIAVGVYHRDH
ncbi:MAG TPA: BON domain-containing protein [Methylomirabilota bacterium]